MANVIREDVVQIGFEIESNPIQKLTDEINKIKSALVGLVGEDAFSDLADEAKKAQEATGGLADEAKNVGSSAKGIGKLKQNIEQTVQTLTGGEKGAKGFTNALKNIAKISVAKLKSGLQAVKEKLTEIARKAGSAAYSSLKKIAGISFKALAVGLGAAATAVGKLIYEAATAFGEFEQLKGGMEKIFDQADTTAIMKDANNAYKDLGMSATEYLSVINDTGATFASTMGDTKGYQTAKTGLTAISDYATGTGKDITALSEKFTLITRSTSSYQSIADQFSGILPATSKDFLKQAQSAGFLSDKYTELTKVPVAEYQSAVAKMLEKGVADLGLAGNTAAEAENTFSGSLGMMKSSWANLITAIGTGENLDQCFDNFIKSAETFGGQLMPVLERAFEGLGTVIDKLAPIVAEKLPGLVEKFLPPLVSAAGKLVASLVANLPAIISALIPAIKEAASQIVAALYEAFTGKEMSADTFSGVTSALDKVGNAIKTCLPVILALVAAFKAYKVVKSVVSSVSAFGKSISNIASKVSGGLSKKMGDVAGGMSKTGKAAKTNSKDMLAAAKSFLMIAGAVLMIAVAFGILAFSAIALANAGGGAIAVMFGLVVALAALGFGMMMLLKSISSVGKKAMPAAMAMLALGGAVILIALGFAILAATAIALANAGGPAIAIMIGFVAVIALLAIGAAVLGTALTAGAVGFLAFGGAIALVGLGFMLLGVGAMLAAFALTIIVGLLPQMIEHGFAGSLAIVALAVALATFALGATLAGAATLLLATGLLTVAAALLAIVLSMTLLNIMLMLFVATLTLLTVPLMMNTMLFAMWIMQLTMVTLLITLLTPLFLVFTATLLPLSVILAVITPLFILLTATMTALMVIMIPLNALMLLFTTTFMLLTVPLMLSSAFLLIISAALLVMSLALAIIVPLLLVFTALLIPLSVAMLVLAPTMLVLVASMTALSVVFALITPLAKSLGNSIAKMGKGFTQMKSSVGTVASKMKSLPWTFTKLIAPAKKAANGLKPVTSQFKSLAGVSTTVASAMARLASLFVVVTACFTQMAQTPMLFGQALMAMVIIALTSSSQIMQIIMTMLKQMLKAFRAINLTKAGVQMLNGLIRGMNSKKAAAVNAAREIAKAINREYAKIQDIHSPSRVYEGFGENQTQGLINGMKNRLPDLQSTVQQTGNIATPYSSYTPETSSVFSSSHEVITENNSYAPAFNLSISGSTDDRATERKVKRWIKDAMDEVFEGMARKSPRVREV